VLAQDRKPLPKEAWGVDVKADPSGRPYAAMAVRSMLATRSGAT